MNRPTTNKEKNSTDILDILTKSRALLEFHREIDLNYPLTTPIKKILHPSKPVTTQNLTEDQRKIKIKTTPQPTISLNDVNTEITGCTRCSIAKNRQGILTGQGCVSKPALLIISDRLTSEDIKTGKILSGSAGELLNKMLSAIKLTEDDVYLTTIIKCCPLTGKTPEPAAIKACLPFVDQQISALCPRIIYTLGQSTAQAMLNTKAPLIRLRNKFYHFNTIPLLPSFHPSFLLKNPEMKKGAWHDLQMLDRFLQSRR